MTGCQLAKESDNQPFKLVGVFITTEHFDQSDGRINARLTTKTYNDPDTGKMSEVKEYVFDKAKGISYLAVEIPYTDTEESFISSGSDEAVCDRHMSINSGDNEGIDIKGSIYITPGIAGRAYYINPVYQSDNGSVYALQATGVYVGTESYEGNAFSQKLHEANTITENGKTRSVDFNVDISISVMLPPSQIVILQMDKDSTMLSREEYAPGKLPDNIKPSAGTSYIIVETHKLDPKGKPVVSYELYNEGNETIKTFYCREDGICIQKYTKLDWSK